MKRTRWTDHAVGAALCTMYIAILWTSAASLSMSRDESFYVGAAESYARWFELLLRDTDRARMPKVIDAHWSNNHEHPALPKSLFAISWLVHQKYEFFPTDSHAFRFPGMVFSGLILWILYIWGAQTFGRAAGFFAAAAYALLPRPFYHAHLNCFDVPITAMLLWSAYLYWRSLQHRGWAFMFAVVYGLTLETKHNSWVLPGVLLIHWAWLALAELRERRQASASTIKIFPLWLVMLPLSMLLFVGMWPWLWTHTRERIQEYVNFHLHHDYYNIAYFGVTYFQPPFPMSYAWVMTLYTWPLTTLVLVIVGVAARARYWLPSFMLPVQATPESEPLKTDVLWMGLALAPLVIMSIPTTPIFGGTKHWFPAYPFMCLFAGVAFSNVAQRLSETWSTRFVQAPALLGLSAWFLAPASIETAHSHGFGLSHYTVPAGGVPGAATKGMNRTFWGVATGHAVDFLKQAMPNGGTVWLCDTTWQAWDMLHRDGRIPRNIQAHPYINRADYILVHLEDHFNDVEFQAWQSIHSPQPVYVVTHDGVPIMNVYHRVP